jgi:hypothetical protein
MEIEMRNFRSLLPVLLLALFAGCSTTPSTPTPDGLTQSGSFTIRENQVLRAAVGHAGEGTLIFQGWQYPFMFENMKVGVAGNAAVELTGTVYNLKQVEDFQGTYTLTTVNIQSEDAVTGIWGKNDKGVVANIRSQGQDLEIDLEATGATFTLK